MPCISQFFGIAIYMYYNDHLTLHFHAMHGGDEALVEFSPAKLYQGGLPPKVLKMVLQWPIPPLP